MMLQLLGGGLMANPETDDERKIARSYVIAMVCNWDNNQPVDVMQIDDLKI